jgi:large subunit ribosomal protein L15
MPLIRRLPKRGFTNIFRKRYATISVRDLNRFEGGSTVDADILLKSGLIKRLESGVKVLGQGEITKPLMLKVNKVTKGARRKVEEAGGNIEVV